MKDLILCIITILIVCVGFYIHTKERKEFEKTVENFVNKKELIISKLELQKKFLLALDNNITLGMITEKQYEKEFAEILKNINEIIDEMDEIGYFEKDGKDA